MIDFGALREAMVETQIASRGLDDSAVLAAMRAIPREAFVPVELAAMAYSDSPLPIGLDQTISQPYIVAFTAEALRLSPTDRVLDIGTGSGYAAAVLARLAQVVYSVERLEPLARAATERLRRLGIDNVHVRVGDGSLGWPEHAPYDAIAVAAAAPAVPDALCQQLAIGGRLVVPIGQPGAQVLLRVTRVAEDRLSQENLGGVAFVSLVGAQGW